MSWAFLGISENQFPKHKKCSGRLLICGSARCIWDDLEKIGMDGHGADVMCLNDFIMHYPRFIKHAYSNDHQSLPCWVHARRPRYRLDFKESIVMHTQKIGNSQMVVWPWPGFGTSGFNAVLTGLGLGYEEIILAGIPLDDSGHYFDPPNTRTKFTQEVPTLNGELKHWADAERNLFKGRVKSLSGRTREVLGAP